MGTSKKMSKIQKMIYGLGDFGSQFIWTFTGSYLTIFYTDIVGLAPAIVSAIMFGARIWDAINDPMFGTIAERTRTKYGRFRPYILFGTPIMALFCVLTFSAPFGNGTARVIWATVTYIGLGMLYTAVNLSYGSLSSVMTTDSEDRIELNFWRMIGANVGQLVLNAVSMPLILFFSAKAQKGTTVATSSGYFYTSFIFAIITLVLFMLVFKNSKEVIAAGKEEKKIPLKMSVKTIIGNKPLICVFLMLMSYCIGLSIHSGLLVYYITYVVKRLDLATILMTVPSVCSILVMFLTKGSIEKVGKKKMLLISYIGMSLATILLGITDPKNIVLIVIFQGMWGAAKFVSPILMGSVPECIDYAEDKFGTICDGIAYSFVSLATKLGPALGPSIGLLALGSSYVANAEQSAETLARINFAVNYLPVAFLLLGIIPVILYPLNKEKNEEIKQRLDKKHAQEN